MKILSLRLQNLNSIRQEVELDFAGGELAQAGLFAITGPTGAGKSTILDAISLALYNSTARKQGHEIVSRGEREAYAEVEFEIHGDIFRSRWSMRLTKDRTTGKLKKGTATMELSQLDSAGGEGELITTGLKTASGVPTKVENLTGLDFKRFQQSMLLAQGQFDAFLMASDGDRSALLEQITGSAIYSEVSMLVFQRAGSVSKDLKARKEVLEKLGLPDLEQEKNWKKEQALIEEKLPGLIKQQASITQLVNLHREHEEQLKQKVLLRTEQETFDASESQRKDDVTRRKLHDKASPLHASVQALETLEIQIKELRQTVAELENKLSDFSSREPKVKEALTFAKTAHEKATKAESLGAIKIAEISADKSVLAKAEKVIKELQTTKAVALEKKTKRDVELANLKATRDELGKACEVIELSLKQTSRLSAAEPFLPQLSKAHKAYHRRLEASNKIKKDVSSHNAELEQTKSELKVLIVDLPVVPKGVLDQGESPQKASTRLQDTINKTADELGELKSFGSNFRSYVELLGQLESKRGQQTILEKALNEAKNKITDSNQKIEQFNLELSEHEKELRLRAEALNALKELSGIREAHAHLLKPGEACPLCGSEEHPAGYEHTAVDMDAHRERVKETTRALTLTTEKLKEEQKLFQAQTLFVAEKETTLKTIDLAAFEEKVEDIKAELNNVVGAKYAGYLVSPTTATINRLLDDYRRLEAKQNAQKEARNKLQEYERLSADKSEQKLKLEAAVAQKEERQKKLIEEQKEAEKNLLESKEILLSQAETAQLNGEKFLIENAVEELREQLASRGKNENELALKKEKLQTTVSAVAKAEEELISTAEELKTLEEKTKQSIGELETTEKSISSKLGVYSSVELMQSGLKAAQDLALTVLKEKEEAQQKLRDERTEIQGQLSEARKRQTVLLTKLNKQTEKLDKDAAEAGFSTVDEVKGALLRPAEKEKIDLRITTATQRETNLRTRVESINTRLDKLTVSLKDQLSLEVLTQNLTSLDSLVGQQQQELGKLTALLKRADDDKKQFAKDAKEIESLEKQANHWATLNKLVGSADGKKFRQFAQGITLQQLLKYANGYLREFYPRFSVSPNPDSDNKPLEILICDHFEADQIRPVNTVSGGERFLVSMALALGFSRMASKNISIDTLFIDEGFGSLDGETLDKAITALEKLQQRGKTIGIISHVAALQERIATQIRLVRQSSGRSKVEIIS